jgi:hypothetical protein
MEPAVVTRINVFDTGLAIRAGTTSCARINAFEYKCPGIGGSGYDGRMVSEHANLEQPNAPFTS